MTNNKIILVANQIQSLYNFRKEFIMSLKAKGYDVIAVAPLDDAAENLEKLDVICLNLQLSRKGINPIEELWIYHHLRAIFRLKKPKVAFNYTIKAVIYGSLAAKAARVQHIYSMITGLGYAFMNSTLKQCLLKQVVMRLYQIALKHNQKVFFLNPDDMSFFISHQLIQPGQACLLNGEGVDLEYFQPIKQKPQPISFLLIARLLWDKGIAEYVDAARILKKKYPAAEFGLLGPFDENPSAIHKVQIEAWEKEGAIRYLGVTTDVRPFLAESDVFVLPSYREGLPRSIIEAMAMGRPVVTTDAPGCRETVLHGVNGFIVPVKDSNALAEAMERFILHPEIISFMGAKSREIAVEKYDVHKINHAIIQAMGLSR